jgi:G3E family GTPase
MIQTQPADPERLTVTDRLPECIPVVLLTGYLGAGKTSLINALIADSELRDTAVVVNEFGEIAVDYDLIQIESRRLLVTSNGCLCCTVASDVRASLFELYEASRTGVAPHFSRVIVETTGLADPAPVVNSLTPGSIPASSLRDQTVAANFRLARVVTCFDTVSGEYALDHAFEAVKQIAFADTVVVTKTDVTEEQGSRRNIFNLRARLLAINPFAEVIDRADVRFVDLFHGAYLDANKVDDVPGWLALDRILRAEGRPAETKGVSSHAHDVRAIPLVCDGTITGERLSLFLRMLLGTAGAQVLRVKGMVAIAGDSDRPTAIHATHNIIHPPVRLAGWPDSDRRSRLIVIGRGLDEKAVDQVFRALMKSDPVTSLSRPQALRPLALIIALLSLIILGVLGLRLSESRVITANDLFPSSSTGDHP